MYTTGYMFERTIYTATWIALLILIGIGGWYAYKNLNNDFMYDSSNTGNDVIDVNFDDSAGEAVEQERSTENSDMNTSTVDTEVESSGESSDESQSNSSSEYSGLIQRLNGLIDDDIYMKVGSRGTRVGTVQEFLNIFLDTTTPVDNDFGPGTKKNVAQFQEQVGIEADGLPGPDTYRAMIKWLNTHS